MNKRLSAMLFSMLLLSALSLVPAHGEETHYVAAFYFALDVTNDSGILVVHDGGKPKITKNASLVKYMDEMYQKRWMITQSNRAPSRTGDYEVVYMLFAKMK